VQISNLIYWGIPSLALVINSLMFLVLTLSKKDNQIRSFMFFIAVMVMWAATSLLMKAQFAPSVLFWNRAMVASITMVPYFAYIFISIFVGQIKKPAFIFWTIVIIAIQTVNIMGLAITSAEMIPVINNGFLSYELQYSMGVVAYFCFGMVFALLAYCMNIMRKALKHGNKASERLKPVLIGLFILYVGMALNIIPAVGKYPIDFAFGIITSGFLMYAIYKTRVIELRIVVTRTVLFTLIMTILFSTVSLSINALIKYIDVLNNGMSQELSILVTTIITIIIFQPLFSLIHRLVDNYFYQKENYQNNLMKLFTLTISNNLNLENISEELMKVIYEVSNNDYVYIFLKNSENDGYNFYSSYKKLDRLSLSFKNSHPFIRWFKQFDDVIFEDYIDNHPFFKTIWDKERQDLLLMRFEAAIPLKYNLDLIGIVLLSSKDNTTKMNPDDLNMVATLCATASIAISNARMFEKAQQEAIVDSLTNVYNHRYFLDQLQKNTRDLRSQIVSLIILNIDMFSVFNDIYGHYAGDLALQKIASIMKLVCGERGIICRYAGDVFAIILPYTDSNSAYELSEKIRLRIETTSMSNEDEISRFITVSAGISIAPSIATDDKDLVMKSILALQHAKTSGKNKSIIFNPSHHQHKVNEETSDELNMATIYALTAAIDAKDHYTFGHSQRVAKYSTAIAEAVNSSKEEIELIRQASLLHDIGKIGIPESILTKYSKLSIDEYETMKKHVDMSITIIKYLPSFNHVIPAVVGHHERWDGLGYPRKIKGKNIPFAARCIAIADAFDAITSDRHYKTFLSTEFALEEIERNAGTQFDPQLSEVFVRLVRTGELIVEPSRNNVSYHSDSAFQQLKT